MKWLIRIISACIIFFILNARSTASVPPTDSMVCINPESAYILAIAQWKNDSANHFWHFKNQPEKILSAQEKATGLQRPSHNTSWLALVVVLGVLLIIICRAVDPEDVPGLFLLLGNSLSRPEKIRDAGDKLSLSSLLLTVNFILMFSAMFYYASEVFRFHVTFGLAWFVIIVGFSTAGISLRYLVLKFIASVFSFRAQFDFFVYQELQYNRLLGIILIPMVLIAISYSGEVTLRPIVFTALGITLLLLFIRYFQGFMIGKEYIRYNTFHFLLYICTLEIAPLLIILKAIGNRVI